MNGTNLAKGTLAVPAITAGIDFLANNHIGETIGWTIGATENILKAGNGFINPILGSVAGGASALLLSNSVLKEFDWMQKHDKIRWGINLAAAGSAFAAGSVVAPYLVAGGLSYAIGKHGWKYGKEALNRVAGTAWGLTGGMVAGGVRSAWKGLKGEQFSGEGLGKLNPKF
ncbi:MAG: hypothetical protein Q8K30_04890 [Candidatus Gracilibacteria bacterium]|nr:hypothetical protein [Candidatus Gracilibacteria bacterium]